MWGWGGRRRVLQISNKTLCVIIDLHVDTGLTDVSVMGGETDSHCREIFPPFLFNRTETKGLPSF